MSEKDILLAKIINFYENDFKNNKTKEFVVREFDESILDK